jgi:hypothetical protein
VEYVDSPRKQRFNFVGDQPRIAQPHPPAFDMRLDTVDARPRTAAFGFKTNLGIGFVFFIFWILCKNPLFFVIKPNYYLNLLQVSFPVIPSLFPTSPRILLVYL